MGPHTSVVTAAASAIAVTSGWVAERLKAPVLKPQARKGLVGSIHPIRQVKRLPSYQEVIAFIL